MTKQLIESKSIMKKIKETENSNANMRMLPKPSPTNIRTKRLLFKICKCESSKNSMPNYVIENRLQKNP